MIKPVIFFVMMGVLILPSWLGAQDAADFNQPAPSDQSVAGNQAPSEQDYRSPFEANPEFVAPDNSVRSRASVSSGETRLSLEGIGIGSEKRVAVINGNTYAEGELKDDIEVVAIRKSEVDVKWGSIARTLKMTELTESPEKASPATPLPPSGQGPMSTPFSGLPPTNFQGDPNNENR